MTNMNDDFSTITLTGTDTITVTDDTFTLSDTILSGQTDYITINTEPSAVNVGKYTLTEDKVSKLDALLKVLEDLEDDNPIKEMYNAQRMLDKIKGK